jgi:hypothetical protein
MLLDAERDDDPTTTGGFIIMAVLPSGTTGNGRTDGRAARFGSHQCQKKGVGINVRVALVVYTVYRNNTPGPRATSKRKTVECAVAVRRATGQPRKPPGAAKRNDWSCHRTISGTVRNGPPNGHCDRRECPQKLGAALTHIHETIRVNRHCCGWWWLPYYHPNMLLLLLL